MPVTAAAATMTTRPIREVLIDWVAARIFFSSPAAVI